MTDRIEVVERRPGDLEVRVGDRRLAAVVPAGVGVPGVADEDLVATVVELLLDHGRPLTDPLDISALMLADPGLLAAVEARLDGR